MILIPISYLFLFIAILLYIRSASKSSSILQNYTLTSFFFRPILLYIRYLSRYLISLSSSPYYSTYAPLPNRIQFYKTILWIISPSITYLSIYGTSPDILFLFLHHYTNLHTHRFQIRSIYILTTVLELLISYLFLQYNFFTLSIYIYYFIHTYYVFAGYF